MNAPPSARDVLRLYRGILRYGQQLQYTDKTYFNERVREEFQKNKSIRDATEQIFQYKRGLALLQNQRIL